MTVIVKHIHLYDTIFLRASSKWLNKLCKEFRPFPRFHVLDQGQCMDYLVENDFISLLDYVKDVLNFEWTSKLCSKAVKFGRVDVLKHLRANGCPFGSYGAINKCTRGTCSLDMIKYLHESGVPWHPQAMSNIACHGHIECIKYAMQIGCKERMIDYTPSIECLDFLIENEFIWDSIVQYDYGDSCICNEAAMRGNITMLKYAHQNGAKLHNSAQLAMENGHLDCLKYALEHQENEGCDLRHVQTVECFKFLLQKYGLEKMKNDFNWVQPLLGPEQHSNASAYLQFVFDSNIPLPTSASYCKSVIFVAADSIEKIKFFMDHMTSKTLASSNLYTALAQKGNLEGLKLAVERNIPCELDSQQLLTRALASGNTDVIKFVRAKFSTTTQDINQLIDSYTIKNILRQSTPTVVIDFLTKEGFQWTFDHLDNAAIGGSLSNVAYLLRQGCQWKKKELCLYKSLVMKFMKHRGCEF